METAAAAKTSTVRHSAVYVAAEVYQSLNGLPRALTLCLSAERQLLRLEARHSIRIPHQCKTQILTNTCTKSWLGLSLAGKSHQAADIPACLRLCHISAVRYGDISRSNLSTRMIVKPSYPSRICGLHEMKMARSCERTPMYPCLPCASPSLRLELGLLQEGARPHSLQRYSF